MIALTVGNRRSCQCLQLVGAVCVDTRSIVLSVVGAQRLFIHIHTMTEIHNPANLDLPPLKINQSSDRQAFEANQEIKALIGSNLLLDGAFSAVYMELFAKTKELRQLIDLARVAEYSPWSQPVRVQPQGLQLS